MQAKEAEQKRRETELKQRDERMQKIMNRMGEAGVGGKREKELLKQAEKDYIAECLRKDEADKRSEHQRR